MVVNTDEDLFVFTEDTSSEEVGSPNRFGNLTEKSLFSVGSFSVEEG
jgi:hypothetical protein